MSSIFSWIAASLFGVGEREREASGGGDGAGGVDRSRVEETPAAASTAAALSSVPDEVVARILSFLDLDTAPDLLSVQLASKRLGRVALEWDDSAVIFVSSLPYGSGREGTEKLVAALGPRLARGSPAQTRQRCASPSRTSTEASSTFCRSSSPCSAPSLGVGVGAGVGAAALSLKGKREEREIGRAIGIVTAAATATTTQIVPRPMAGSRSGRTSTARWVVGVLASPGGVTLTLPLSLPRLPHPLPLPFPTTLSLPTSPDRGRPPRRCNGQSGGGGGGGGGGGSGGGSSSSGSVQRDGAGDGAWSNQSSVLTPSINVPRERRGPRRRREARRGAGGSGQGSGRCRVPTAEPARDGNGREEKEKGGRGGGGGGWRGGCKRGEARGRARHGGRRGRGRRRQ